MHTLQSACDYATFFLMRPLTCLISTGCFFFFIFFFGAGSAALRRSSRLKAAGGCGKYDMV
jgi:hypothetical protein